MLDDPPEYSQGNLPSYQSSNTHYAIAYKKTELVSPFHVAKSRSWNPVIVCLNSTQLNFYSFKSSRLANFVDFFFKKIDLCVEELFARKQAESFSKNTSTATAALYDDDEFDAWGGPGSTNNGSMRNMLKHANLLPTGPTSKFDNSILRCKTGSFYDVFNTIASIFKIPQNEADTIAKLIFTSSPQYGDHGRELNHYSPLMGALDSSYTLQYCQIGKASDYEKKNFLLRLRIELDQLLLKFVNLRSLVQWYHLLAGSVQLSLPVEQRFADKNKTMSGRSVRRSVARHFVNDNGSDLFNATVATTNNIFHLRRNSDVSINSHYEFDTLRRNSAYENGMVYDTLDKNQRYSISLVESMDFYRHMRKVNPLRPNIKQFHQAALASSSRSINLDQSGLRSYRADSNISDTSVSSEPSSLSLHSHHVDESSLQSPVSSDNESLVLPKNTPSPPLNVLDYQLINEVELFDVIYAYKCIRSLRSSDQWMNCFVVLSSKAQTAGETMASTTSVNTTTNKKQALIKKIRKNSTSKQNTAETLVAEAIDSTAGPSLHQLSKYGVQLFTSEYASRAAYESLSPIDIETHWEFREIQALNAEFFKKILAVADCSKRSLEEKNSAETPFSRFVFIDSYSILKFLKALKANKLSILNRSVDSQGRQVMVENKPLFCKTMMIIEEGLIGWL